MIIIGVEVQWPLYIGPEDIYLYIVYGTFPLPVNIKKISISCLHLFRKVY